MVITPWLAAIISAFQLSSSPIDAQRGGRAGGGNVLPNTSISVPTGNGH